MLLMSIEMGALTRDMTTSGAVSGINPNYLTDKQIEHLNSRLDDLQKNKVSHQELDELKQIVRNQEIQIAEFRGSLLALINRK